MTALEHKEKGNEACKEQRWSDAVSHFTAAIAVDASDAVFFSNRCAAYLALKEGEKALNDANEVIARRPEWEKGYLRKGAALHMLGRLHEAESAYKDGLKKEPQSNALASALAQVSKAKEDSAALQMLWKTMDWWGAIQAHPMFADHAQDSTFRDKLDAIAANPAKLAHYANDPPVQGAVEYLISAWKSAMYEQERAQKREKALEEQRRTRREEEKKREKEEAAAAEEARIAAMSPEERQALTLKNEGSAAYQAKQFDEAEAKFTQALELMPDDVALLTNRAAVRLQTGDFDGAIADGELAVERGRSTRADYALIARAFDRIGSAYAKKEDHVAALKAFNSSLSENRTASVLKKMQATEKAIDVAAKKAYECPEKAAAARAEGNRLFKDQRYPEAIKQYEEAIKRDPRDAKLHTNMAAALSKLMEYPSAVAACDRAIALDPNFTKAHFIRGNFLFHMKDYKNALEAYTAVTRLDSNYPGLSDATMRVQYAIAERNRSGGDKEAAERAARDPEVQAILGDPTIMQILQQAQEDPNSLAHHMENPLIADKINKLIASGALGVR